MNSIPKFFNLLSDSDKLSYFTMKAQFAMYLSTNQRNKRISTFNEILQIIKKYCIKKDQNDWVRCLVCGVMWLPEGIAINNQQLRILTSKCKSSINGSLVRVGYSITLGRSETSSALVQALPLLKDNTSELRQWTIRKGDPTLLHSSPSPSPPPLHPIPILKKPLLQVVLFPNEPENISESIDTKIIHDCDEPLLNDYSNHSIGLSKFESDLDPSLDSLYGMPAGVDFNYGLF